MVNRSSTRAAGQVTGLGVLIPSRYPGSTAQPPPQPRRGPRGDQGGREREEGRRGEKEEGPQAPQEGPQGRLVPYVSVALEVTRGGSACGPPSEPAERVTAPTRAACASWEKCTKKCYFSKNYEITNYDLIIDKTFNAIMVF